MLSKLPKWLEFGAFLLAAIAGGTLGAWGFDRLAFTALALPALLCAGLAFIYRVFIVRADPLGGGR